MNDRHKQTEACYDTVAPVYADRFRSELDNKPLDRLLLERFAARNQEKGLLCDLGCGPGQIAAYLHGLGASKVMGADVSQRMVEEAAAAYPHILFQKDDMLQLSLTSDSLAGIAAFYSIVHFTEDDLHTALKEMHRVLMHEGELLLSFHIGSGTVYVERFLDADAAAVFCYHEPEAVIRDLQEAGFAVMDAVIRFPYPGVEAATRRCYIHAIKHT